MLRSIVFACDYGGSDGGDKWRSVDDEDLRWWEEQKVVTSHKADWDQIRFSASAHKWARILCDHGSDGESLLRKNQVQVAEESLDAEEEVTTTVGVSSVAMTMCCKALK